MDWGSVLIGPVAVAAMTAVIAYFGHRITSQFDRLLETQAQIDLDLRERRLPAYERLWALTRVLPEWPRDTTRTYEDVEQFSGALRDWYFGTGGWLLSGPARIVYGTVQESLWDPKIGILREHDGASPGRRTGVLDPEDYDVVRKRCSALRTEMTRDLQSRRVSPIVDQPT